MRDFRSFLFPGRMSIEESEHLNCPCPDTVQRPTYRTSYARAGMYNSPRNPFGSSATIPRTPSSMLAQPHRLPERLFQSSGLKIRQMGRKKIVQDVRQRHSR